MNSQEIAIMGGLTMEEEEVTYLGDVTIYNVASKSASRVVQSYRGMLQFESKGNSCERFAENNIIALAENQDDGKVLVVQY